MLWGRFPDQRYTDSIAVGETLYDALWGRLELARQRAVFRRCRLTARFRWPATTAMSFPTRGSTILP